ncbi:MAG: HD domain-containing protein [Spirochaetes bacterium]|nr:HD domain-containing protein [Spirochaetota bacterium]
MAEGAPVSTAVRVLILEDDARDAELMNSEMDKSEIQYDYRHVDNERDYIEALDEFRPEVVISDFCIPSYDGFLALEAVRRRDREIPFIFVSGAIGEDLAIEAIRRGATDCINKNHLGKLPSAFRRAVEEFRERLQRREAESAMEQLRTRNTLILDSAGEGILGLDEALRFVSVNRSGTALLGYRAEELAGKGLDILFGSEIPPLLSAGAEGSGNSASPSKRSAAECSVRAKGGNAFDAECRLAPIYEAGRITGYVLTVSDVTDRVLARDRIREGYRRLNKTLFDSIHAVSMALECRDPYTAGHQKRVAHLTIAMGRILGMNEDRSNGLYLASSVHDLGKISIPAEILTSPRKLSEIEFEIIKEHPESGYRILRDIEYPWPIAQAVYQHHERLDGSGYPRGLKGEEIIAEARIIAVADVVEAMASHRPYRPAMGVERALEEIQNNAGTFYEERVVEACLSLFRGGFDFS